MPVPMRRTGYRFRMQSARSWVEENFESPELRLFFASAALHAGLAPDDPLGGEFAWLFLSAVQDVGVSIVTGGMHQVTRALAAVLAEHGGEIRLGAEVATIEVEQGRGVGLRLAGGERIAVDGPIAVNADPRHLVRDLLGDAAGAAARDQIDRYEWGPSFFGIYAALDRPVAFKAGPEAAAAGYIHASHASIDALARSFADLRARAAAGRAHGRDHRRGGARPEPRARRQGPDEVHRPLRPLAPCQR